MSAAIESIQVSPDEQDVFVYDVDTLLERVATQQRAAEYQRNTRLARLYNIGGLLTRNIAPDTDEVIPMSFGTEVLPSFVSPRKDRYGHVSFKEENNPTLAHEAWRIHTEGYLSSGFVNDDALEAETGLLKAEIDKSRGPYIDYHIAFNPNPEKPYDRATLRIDGLAPGGTYKDLPAYQLCKDSLSDEGIELLESITDQDRRVKEIAAMAKTDKGNPLGVHEIIRKIIQDAQGEGQVWMFSIVSTTIDSLIKSFGAKNFKIIGENVAIPDERVNPDIRLTPTVLYPDNFIDTILESFNEAEDPHDKLRLMRSLMFLTEGLRPDQMSDAVREMRQSLLEKANHQAPESNA